MRTYPVEAKNPIIDTVYWFYKDYLGVKPDRHLYSRFQDKNNPRSLVPLLCQPDNDLDMEVYTPEDVADLVYYLEDNGVKVETLGVITIPGLMFNFKNRKKLARCKENLDETVSYLCDDINDKSFEAPVGW